MSVTIEMPSLLMLRVSFRPGTPAIPRSIGCVIWDSTLGRRERGCTRDDLDLDVREIGDGVDRELFGRVEPGPMMPRQIMTRDERVLGCPEHYTSHGTTSCSLLGDFATKDKCAFDDDLFALDQTLADLGNLGRLASDLHLPDSNVPGSRSTNTTLSSPIG